MITRRVDTRSDQHVDNNPHRSGQVSWCVSLSILAGSHWTRVNTSLNAIYLSHVRQMISAPDQIDHDLCEISAFWRAP
jgi:hypothetical protein